MKRALLPAAVLAVAAAGCSGSTAQTAVPFCAAGSADLTLEQARNAATISAVGKRVGVPDHGVTVALATALQESGLRNLDHGDRDSLGLFQQRPSQGWGSAATVQDPRSASASFYRHLLKVPDWQALDVTVAAQRVQHSAAPEAYAQWESAARQLAAAMTGEVAAGLTCQFAARPGAVQQQQLQSAATTELGVGGLARTTTPARTWTTASWLVAHAHDYGVTQVSVAGRAWQATRGTWVTDPRATALTWS